MSLFSIGDRESSLARSLQVINSTNCVIRELVENSIDARSTKIEIKVHNAGLDLIQVSDNGTGISESNFELLASKHTTSKIRKFEDIFSSLTTFGFRGEALYSLCNLSTVEVETRVPSIDHGWLLKFDSVGRLTSKLPIGTNVGTCVRVRDLFSNYPVRHKNLVKSAKGQIAKAISQLQQYALINPGISFKFTSISGNNISNLFSTSGESEDVRGVVKQLFGTDFATKMIDVQIADKNWRIDGLVSSPYIERGSRDLEYFYINKRPIGKIQKFKNAIAAVFSHFSSRSKASFILNLTIDYDNVDINLSPDKRSAFLLSEDYIVKTLRDKLYDILTPKTFNSAQINSDLLKNFLSQSQPVHLDRVPVETNKDGQNANKQESGLVDKKRDLEARNESKSSKRQLTRVPTVTEDSPVKTVKSEAPTVREEPPLGKSLQDFLDSSRDVDVEAEDETSESCELLRVNRRALDRSRRPFLPEDNSQHKSRNYEVNRDDLDDHNILDPKVFNNMRLVGQFNNSFIITKLSFPEIDSDLNYSVYIIDQHAADEKAKFENLNKSVKINRQRVINPKLIELSPFLTQVAEQHLDLLLSNGFDTTLRKGRELVMYRDSEMTMSTGLTDQMAKGVYVHSFPHVLGKVLNEEDFVDFINHLSTSEDFEIQKGSDFIWGAGVIPRPRKVWSILASRACKSSIRMGDALTKSQMKKIISNLATLIHPWNCPHGRPSIKCLISHNQLNALFRKHS